MSLQIVNELKRICLSLLEKAELVKRKFVNPEKYIKTLFLQRMGYPLNLDNPRTYSEKLQWLKLYWHLPILTTLVDKYAVKEFVRERIGDKYIIPTLAVWDSVKEIQWEELPNQFVLKCTHDSGGLVICKDKSRFDRRQAIKVINKSLSNNYYYFGYEWPYKNVQPRIIAEPYLEDSATKELRDYKFFCFNGKVKALFIATDRNVTGVDVKFDFFDDNFHHLPFKQGHENAAAMPQKPVCFEEMKQLACRLSEGFPHVRVDLYEVDGRVFFGEMTFFHHGGWTKFDPEDWDSIFGGWLSLPEKSL